MISSLIVGAILNTAADSEAKIVSASLFKNGYAMVLREVPVDASGAVIVDIPRPSLGTLWFFAGEGVKIKQVVATSRDKEVTTQAPNFAELIRLNKGKKAYIETTSGTRLEGQIQDIVGELVYLKTTGLVAMRASDIRSLGIDGEANTNSTGKTQQKILQFATQGSGKIYLIGLERGMTWSPAYSVDIMNDKEVQLTAKSTLINDLGKLDNAEIRFVTGFPNVPWAGYREPLTSGDNMESFINALNSVGISGPGGSGGFAGRRESMGQMTMNQAAAADFEAGPEIGGQGAGSLEDLFFYKQPNVSLKQGDRAFYVLFQSKAEFKRVFTLELPDTIGQYVYGGYDNRPATPPQAPDVWNTIRFKNTSGQPLTTAPATVFSEGQILGQDTLMYTSVDAEARIKMSKALDVRPDAAEEEQTRERGSLKTPNYGTFDLVTVKGTINLKNGKNIPVKMNITKFLTGEVESASMTPKIVKLAQGLKDVNSRSQIDWNIELQPLKTTSITYTYKVYVRS